MKIFKLRIKKYFLTLNYIRMSQNLEKLFALEGGAKKRVAKKGSKKASKKASKDKKVKKVMKGGVPPSKAISTHVAETADATKEMEATKFPTQTGGKRGSKKASKGSKKASKGSKKASKGSKKAQKGGAKKDSKKASKGKKGSRKY